ncbi:MAG: N-acetylmuramoyl-L-alanine amidase [Agathobacter sp.]|nr:N-acetylmuramoyl-L-alanine amidase [Agathobacter sp.]
MKKNISVKVGLVVVTALLFVGCGVQQVEDSKGNSQIPESEAVTEKVELATEKIEIATEELEVETETEEAEVETETQVDADTTSKLTWEKRPDSGQGFSVCIDPGHQSSGDSNHEPNGPGSSVTKARVTGGTKGAYTGIYEYQLNLTVAQQLKAELESRGYTVYMTRESHDVNISNMERAQYATQVGADITIRIHANGCDDGSVSGAMALAPSGANPYVSAIAEESQKLSTCVLDYYCSETGLRNRGVSQNDTMTGINFCTMPVTIIEMGYMTNYNDDVMMNDAEFQTHMVTGLANGIDAYFSQW